MTDITLDSIVRGYLLNNGYNTLHKYVRSLKYCTNFLKEFSINHSYGDKTVALKMDYKKSVQYPQDAMVIKKVGWLDGDRIVAFDVDETISLHHSRSEDLISPTLNQPYQVIQPLTRIITDPENNRESQTSGLGYNYSGYFKLNNQAKEIQFSSEVTSTREIIVTYASNGFNPKTKSTIPEMYSNVAENYIHWQWARFKMGDSAGETEARRQAFWNSYDNIYASQHRVSYEHLVGAKARAHDINRTA